MPSSAVVALTFCDSGVQVELAAPPEAAVLGLPSVQAVLRGRGTSVLLRRALYNKGERLSPRVREV